jgi:hypothetical protein
MRNALCVMFVCLVSSRLARGQDAKSPVSSIECVQRLTMPNYPALALHAKIQGTVIAHIRIDADKTAQIRLELTAKPPHIDREMGTITPAVERTLLAAKWRSECTGQNVILIFDFEIDQFQTPGSGHRVSVGPPNHFWITAAPPGIEAP